MLLLSSSAFFSQLFLKKKSFRKTIRVSNSLDPDQDGRFVGPDLGQTVCKGYQQMKKVPASNKRGNLSVWME